MAKSITQKQKFSTLISIVESNPDFSVVIDGETLTANGLIKFLNERIEALDKKATKTSDKTNTEQAEVDEKVLSVMTTEKRKVAEIAKAVNTKYDTEYTSSKVTASLTRLCKEDKVINEKEGKNSYYRLVD